MRMKGAVAVAFVAMAAACTSAAPTATATDHGRSPRSSPTNGPTIALGGGSVAGFRLVRTLSLKVSAESVFAFGDWVVWSTGPGPAGGTPPAPTEYDAFNSRTGRIVTVRGHEPGAVLNLATGAGDTLVEREVVAQPDSVCNSSLGCFHWALWVISLPDGRSRKIAASRQPVSPSGVPIPSANGDWAAWQEVDAGKVVTVSSRLDTAETHVLATGPAASAVSVDGKYVYLDDGTVRPPRMLRIRVRGGPTETLYQSAKFYRPAVAAGEVAMVAGIPTQGMRVLLAHTAARLAPRAVYRSNEIYYAWPVGRDEVVVRDFQGVEVTRPGSSPVTLSTTVVGSSAIAVVGQQVTMLLPDGTRSKIETVDLGSG